MARSGDGAAEAAGRKDKLELLPDRVRLTGGDKAGPVEVSYAELAGVWLEGGMLVLERQTGDQIRIESEEEGPIVLELARLASFLRPDPSAQSFAVIVPLKPGSGERGRGLLEQGPPFDPEALQLAPHRVLLSEGEAVFVFDAPPETLDKLLADPIAWSAAAAWRDSVAGLARMAEQAYSWGGFRLDRVDAGESTTPAR
jgi:hypothetical protein